MGVANEWPELSVDGRRRYRSLDKQARGQLRHIMNWPPCLDLLSSCHAHCGPFCHLLAGRVIASTGVAAVASCEPAQCRQALHVVSEVAYKGIYASLNGAVVLRVACVSVSVTFDPW